MFNPFENAGKIPNPFEKTAEFGVVGCFELTPPADEVTRLESDSDARAATDVEVVIE